MAYPSVKGGEYVIFMSNGTVEEDLYQYREHPSDLFTDKDKDIIRAIRKECGNRTPKSIHLIDKSNTIYSVTKFYSNIYDEQNQTMSVDIIARITVSTNPTVINLSNIVFGFLKRGTEFITVGFNRIDNV